ncbi:MAG: hypothetical protein QXX41_07885 [Nitrososphaerota archaeon]
MSLIKFLSKINFRRKNIHPQNQIVVQGDSEAEKQWLIWNAFGVDHSKELDKLNESTSRTILQIKSGVLSEEMRNFIEDVIRDEVKKQLRAFYDGKRIP